jgi:hypothetical protein
MQRVEPMKSAGPRATVSRQMEKRQLNPDLVDERAQLQPSRHTAGVALDVA